MWVKFNASDYSRLLVRNANQLVHIVEISQKITFSNNREKPKSDSTVFHDFNIQDHMFREIILV
jgi:hypothetical protein